MLTPARQRVLRANGRAARIWRYGAKLLGCGGRSVELPDDVRRSMGLGLIASSGDHCKDGSPFAPYPSTLSRGRGQRGGW